MGVCLTLYAVRTENLHGAAEDDIYGAIGEVEDSVDFDKSWHLAHYLLTGSAEPTDSPLSILVETGTRLTASEDIHLLSPQQMLAFRDALSDISDDELHSRFDVAAMIKANVYLADAFVDDAENGWEYVAEALPGLRALADTCVDNGLGALTVAG